MPRYSLKLNGQTTVVDAPADMPLLWVLRDRLELTGTKYGCGVGICGACTVHIGGAPARSCQVAVSDVDGDVTSVEGLSKAGFGRLQHIWAERQVAQCGYCQTGMLMAAAGLLKANPHPTREDIDGAMTNICRCGTYPRIRAAILEAAERS